MEPSQNYNISQKQTPAVELGVKFAQNTGGDWLGTFTLDVKFDVYYEFPKIGETVDDKGNVTIQWGLPEQRIALSNGPGSNDYLLISVDHFLDTVRKDALEHLATTWDTGLNAGIFHEKGLKPDGKSKS